MKILAAIDLNETSQRVVAQAKRMAELFSAKLWLLHVAEPEPDFVGYEIDTEVMRDVIAGRFHTEHQQLQQIAQELRDGGIECAAVLAQGATARTILDQAQRLEIDMLVVGSHGKGLIKQLLIGSTSESVIHQTKVPVLVVPT